MIVIELNVAFLPENRGAYEYDKIQIKHSLYQLFYIRKIIYKQIIVQAVRIANHSGPIVSISLLNRFDL